MSTTPYPALSHVSVDSNSEMSFQSAASFESAHSSNSATERLLGGECWEAGNAPVTAADPTNTQTTSIAASGAASAASSNGSDMSFESDLSATARLLGGECWEDADAGEGGCGGKSAGVIPRFVGARPCLTPGRPLKSTAAAMRVPVDSTIAPGFSSSELLRRYVEAGASGRREEPSEKPSRALRASEAATPQYLGASVSFAVPPSPPSPYASAKPFQHLGDQQPLSPSPVRVLAAANSFVGALEEACAGNKTPETLDTSSSPLPPPPAPLPPWSYTREDVLAMVLTVGADGGRRCLFATRALAAQAPCMRARILVFSAAYCATKFQSVSRLKFSVPLSQYPLMYGCVWGVCVWAWAGKRYGRLV